MRQAQIISTGLYAPEKIVANDYFDRFYQKDISSFLISRRNIYQRHYMDESQATSDLIVPAANQALERAGLTAKDLQLIIVSTDTPDYLSPATAAVVQHKLGASRAGTFDINAACAGFVTALDIGAKYMMADERYRNILVVGAYGMSKFLNWDDYKIATLFADGAGAVILSSTPSGRNGFLASQLYTDGQYHDYMGVYGGGTYRPVSSDLIARKDHLLNFAKRIPLETNGRLWPQMARSLCDRIQRPVEDVSTFFMTQINIESIHQTLDNLGLDRARSHNIMDRYGYTGSAAIPMAMADADHKGLLRKGDLIMLLSSGGGLAMAGAALTWGYDS